MLSVDLPSPELAAQGGLFRTVLVVHATAGLIAVAAGLVAATARKRPGRHPRAGRVYLTALGVVVATAAIMAVLRWPHDRHLLAVAVVTGGLAAVGWWARRRRPQGWVRWHAIGLGGSYVGLLTGFYVDNGPRLPLWNRLPDWAFWVLPSLVGGPLIAWGVSRFRGRPPAAGRRAGSPRPSP